MEIADSKPTSPATDECIGMKGSLNFSAILSDLADRDLDLDAPSSGSDKLEYREGDAATE